MDVFDEISPIYEDKAAVILSELMKTKVKRVWVTSRPVQKETLERKLSVFSFGMKRLSRESQKEMLRNLWECKAGEKEKELNNFLWSVNMSVHDKTFTGSPLYIKMLDTVYKSNWEELLNPEDLPWRKIDLVNMYEKFVDRKLGIHLEEKQKADTTLPSVLDNNEFLKQMYLEKFEQCALVAILPPSMLQSLHNKELEEEIQPFLAKVQAGKEKTGIVMNVVDGKPQFVHRTFAEFFTARWFSRNFKDNRSVLEDILFDRTCRVMRDMFDRMLARDCPLHCAVIDEDEVTFKTMLVEGGDRNVVDKGGRTFMHVLATRVSSLWAEINHISNDKISLHNTDSVLQWTPLQYAIKSEKLCVVERLLKRSVEGLGLDMMRQRAQDTAYTGPIIIQAALDGHMLLLEFLCGIGVNIHQASSRSFPSPLHAAIEGQQLKVVKWLIQQGADCNTRYSDGQTPLFHAVTRLSLDVVRALVEEGSASLDIRDDKGRTAIDWAKEYMSVSGHHHILHWKSREKDLKKIVKYLQEMCKVSSGVRQNINS